MVWQALTDPAQLREWAPFDADGNLGDCGAGEAHVGGNGPCFGNHRDAGRGAAAAGVYWRDPVGAGAARRRHAAHALAQYRSPLHRVGRRGLAICFDVLERLLGGEPIGRIAGAEAMKPPAGGDSTRSTQSNLACGPSARRNKSRGGKPCNRPCTNRRS